MKNRKLKIEDFFTTLDYLLPFLHKIIEISPAEKAKKL